MQLKSPRNAPEALAQALRLERAWQIIRDGYSFWPDAELGTVAVVKPGCLHTAYWLEEFGTVCSCRDFKKTNSACKHIIAYALVASQSIPTIASTNPTTVRLFCQKRDAEAAAAAAQEVHVGQLDADYQNCENFQAWSALEMPLPW